MPTDPAQPDPTAPAPASDAPPPTPQPPANLSPPPRLFLDDDHAWEPTPECPDSHDD
jgi:hypothetical protein